MTNKINLIDTTNFSLAGARYAKQLVAPGAPEFTQNIYTRDIDLEKYGINTMEGGNVYVEAIDSNSDVLIYEITGGDTLKTEDGDFSQKKGPHGTLTLDVDEGFFTYKTNDTIASQLAYGDQVSDTFTITVTEEETEEELSDTATVEITLVGKMCNEESSCNYGKNEPCAINDCLGTCGGSAKKSGKVCYKVVTI